MRKILKKRLTNWKDRVYYRKKMILIINIEKEARSESNTSLRPQELRLRITIRRTIP